MQHSHFEGKSPLDHLIAARKRGAKAQAESHGSEAAGHIAAGLDSARESSIYLLALWLFTGSWVMCAAFALLLIIWKTGRSARLGWARLERLHRLIEQERWEITHHRAQEKEELMEMYHAKGLRGELLKECVEVLMADDNRLLQVMLEEELGLTLESYEHPLKQGIGAGVGVLAAAGFVGLGLYLWGFFGGAIGGGIVLFTSALLSAKLEGNDAIKGVIWHLLLGIATVGAVYFVHI